LNVYLVDGTYELFRHYYALPSARDEEGREVAAVRGVLASVLGMIIGDATQRGCDRSLSNPSQLSVGPPGFEEQQRCSDRL
jgi:hypothetical protein